MLPKGFVRIRYFGVLAPRCRTRALAQCRQVLAVDPTPASVEGLVTARPQAHVAVPPLPPMRVVERLTARQLFLEALTHGPLYDTS